MVLAGLVIAAAPWSVAGAFAASPSPSPPASQAPEPGVLTAVEAWLDTPFAPPRDVPEGGVLEIGITFWNARLRDFASVPGVYVRLLPAKGKVAVSDGDLREDWPGHVVANLTVPKGGAGDLEIGVGAIVCTADGSCANTGVPIRIAGTGPPPDALLAQLLDARLLPVVGDVVAGRPFSLAVSVMPRGLWDLAALGLPDRLTVNAGYPGGPQLATAELRATGVGTPYVGSLTFPETGHYLLSIAVTENGTTRAISAPLIPLTVIEPGLRPGETPGAGTPGPASPDPGFSADDDTSVFAWLAGIGLLLVIGGAVAWRLLGDR